MKRFNFFLDLDEDDLLKAAELEGEDRYKNMIVTGVGSDNTEDTDGEILEPSGYILDHFLRAGTINWEHLAKKDPSTIIGEPISAEVKGNEFRIKAKLYSEVPLARKVYDMMINLRKSGSTRKVGLSIEGKALERDKNNDKRITKARISHVALTFSPKNWNTWADIMKGEQVEDYIEPEFDESANGGAEYILELVRPDGMKITIDKDYKVTVVKAMSTTTAAALMPESLDRKLHLLQPDFIKSVKSLYDSGIMKEDFYNRFKKNLKEIVLS